MRQTTVTPKLFEPPKDLKLSVSQIHDLDYPEIVPLGLEVVKKSHTSQTLYGWGELQIQDVEEAGLLVDLNDDPPRHAHIIGWPKEPGERKLRQKLLARIARRVPCDPPIVVRDED